MDSTGVTRPVSNLIIAERRGPNYSANSIHYAKVLVVLYSYV